MMSLDDYTEKMIGEYDARRKENDGWLKVGTPEYSAHVRDKAIDSLKDMTADDMEIIIKHIDNRLLQSKPPTVVEGPDLLEYLNRGDR